MMRTIIRYLIIAGFFGIIGFSYAYHLPNFKVWLMDQIEQQTSKRTPVRVLISNLNFTVIPFGISLENIRVFPSKELKNNFEPIHMKQVQN